MHTRAGSPSFHHCNPRDPSGGSVSSSRLTWARQEGTGAERGGALCASGSRGELCRGQTRRRAWGHGRDRWGTVCALGTLRNGDGEQGLDTGLTREARGPGPTEVREPGRQSRPGGVGGWTGLGRTVCHLQLLVEAGRLRAAATIVVLTWLCRGGGGVLCPGHWPGGDRGPATCEGLDPGWGWGLLV